MKQRGKNNWSPIPLLVDHILPSSQVVNTTYRSKERPPRRDPYLSAASSNTLLMSHKGNIKFDFYKMFKAKILDIGPSDQ